MKAFGLFADGTKYDFEVSAWRMWLMHSMLSRRYDIFIAHCFHHWICDFLSWKVNMSFISSNVSDGADWKLGKTVSHVDDAGFSALVDVRHLPVWLKNDEWWQSHFCFEAFHSSRKFSQADKDRLTFQRLNPLHLSPIPKFSTPVSVSGVNIWSPMTAMLVKEVCWNHLMQLSAWGSFLE